MPKRVRILEALQSTATARGRDAGKTSRKKSTFVGKNQTKEIKEA